MELLFAQIAKRMILYFSTLKKLQLRSGGVQGIYIYIYGNIYISNRETRKPPTRIKVESIPPTRSKIIPTRSASFALGI